MRGARWFLLAAILAILGSVGLTYVNQRRDLENGAPQKPEPLPLDIGEADASQSGKTYRQKTVSIITSANE